MTLLSNVALISPCMILTYECAGCPAVPVRDRADENPWWAEHPVPTQRHNRHPLRQPRQLRHRQVSSLVQFILLGITRTSQNIAVSPRIEALAC